MPDNKSTTNLESQSLLFGSKTNINYGTKNNWHKIHSSTKNFYLNYPKAVLFILFMKLFESFSANGIRTVLVLFLRNSLNFTETTSTSFLHVFNFFSQFCPILGAILADSYLGNADTIFYFLIFYAFGWAGMITSTIPGNNVSFIMLTAMSLLFISIGNGSIRACVTSFGGMQFQLPEQKSALEKYFSHFYFAYYFGMLFSKVIPPSVRAHTSCFGQCDCYAAVFGVLGGAFFCCWIIYLIGMFFYKKEKVCEGNIMVDVIKCIWFGWSNKHSSKKGIRAAIGRYSEGFVGDVESLLKVSKLFLPLPIYFALLAQQDSTWTFQATQLNTTIFGVKIEADQAKSVGPIMLLIMIPLWEHCVHPSLAKRGYGITSLTSVIWGGIFGCLAFICSGLLQICIEQTGGQSQQQISVLWQMPQFFLLMVGEVLLSIPGLQFAFTQAPKSMKSVLMALWYMNNAMGNLIVVLISEVRPFRLQSVEYFLYAGLMFIGISIFSRLARGHVYVQVSSITRRNSVFPDSSMLINNIDANVESNFTIIEKSIVLTQSEIVDSKVIS